MSENIENKFKKLMEREGMEKLVEKPKEVFIARFRLYDEKDATLIEKFDTKEEMNGWYEAFGKWLEEEGGVIEFDEGPSELGSQ